MLLRFTGVVVVLGTEVDMENDVFVSYRGFDCDFENSLQKIVGNSHPLGADLILEN